MPLKGLSIFIAWATVLPMSALAQQSEPATAWDGLANLAQGSEIRVKLVRVRTVRGFLQKASSDSLIINATNSQEMLARRDIRRVYLKRPGHRGSNTLLGLGIGVGGGLAAGAIADAGRKDSWLPNAGKQILTPLGALIGIVIGAALPSGNGWREIYRAP